MRPIGHVVTSAVSAGIVSSVTQSIMAGLSCFVAGVLIDLDHLMDYYLFKGFTLSYREFSQAMYQVLLPRHILLLHSYELILLYWIWIILAGIGPVGWGVGVGLTVHLVMDQLFNKHSPGAYFFIYRAINGFRTSAMFPVSYKRGGRETS